MARPGGLRSVSQREGLHPHLDGNTLWCETSPNVPGVTRVTEEQRRHQEQWGGVLRELYYRGRGQEGSSGPWAGHRPVRTHTVQT